MIWILVQICKIQTSKNIYIEIIKEILPSRINRVIDARVQSILEYLNSRIEQRTVIEHGHE